jgi:hypothetical protein
MSGALIAYSSAPTGLVAFALMLWGLRIDDKNAKRVNFEDPVGNRIVVWQRS